jgi:hypothetical protein
MRWMLPTVLLSLGLCAPAAPAMTLTNHDGTERKITIIEGDKLSDRTLKPSEKIEICQQSCVIKTPDGDEYEFDGPELVLIEDGILVLDLPEDQTKAH